MNDNFSSVAEDTTAIRLDGTVDDFHQRALASPVLAEHGMDLARHDRKRNVIICDYARIRFRYATEFKSRHGAGTADVSGCSEIIPEHRLTTCGLDGSEFNLASPLFLGSHRLPESYLSFPFAIHPVGIAELNAVVAEDRNVVSIISNRIRS